MTSSLNKYSPLCGICLSTDRKVYAMGELSEIYLLMISLEQTTKLIPPYMCAFCGVLMKKFNLFRNIAKQSHQQLQFAYDSFVNPIKSINIANLTQSNIKTETVDKNGFVQDNETHIINYIKEENNLEVKPEPVNVKESNDYIKSDDEYFDSDDNKVIISFKKSADDDEDFNVSTDEDFAEIDIQPTKKKRKKAKSKIKACNTKLGGSARVLGTKEEMEKFEKTYYFKIVEMSREEQLQEIENRKEVKDSTMFSCEYCFKGFLTKTTIENHYRNFHDIKNCPYKCELCNVMYKFKSKLNTHMLTHKYKFYCQQCSFTCTRSSSAKSHHTSHSGHLFDCKYCSMTFKAKSSQLSHLRIKHQDTLQTTCELCGEAFLGKRGLMYHKARSHKEILNSTESPEGCNSCGTKFYNAEALQHHLMTSPNGVCSSDNNLKPCLQCGENFESEQFLKSHLLNEHRACKKIKYCNVCNKRFVDERSLGQHYMSFHSGARARRPVTDPALTPMCEFCGKFFKNKQQIEKHIRTHTGEKPFQCDVCPKSFTVKVLLQYHMNTHTGARPYKCKVCGKGFSSYANVSRHQVVHTGERRYRCEICDKTFQCSTSMKMHVKTVHMKVPMPPRIRKRNKTIMPI